MRDKYEEQLLTLNTELMRRGALCEEAISCAVRSLTENDGTMKQRVSETEKQIDHKERDIESLCMKLLIHQQPVATDFRMITSALKMISDMERIGDQAEDIAEIAEYISGIDLKSKDTLNEMAKTAVDMVMKSIESYIEQSTKIAYSVIKEDDTMDELFMNAKKQLICEIQNSSSENAEALVDILMIAKYFERIGDHAENIAEWVVYSLTGKHDF